MSFCPNCGKEFTDDSQKFCPHCGQARPIPVVPVQPQSGTVPASPKPVFDAGTMQTDPKTVRASSLRRDFEAAAPKPEKKRKLGFWTKLIGTALILYGLTIVFPQTKTPFVRVLKGGEPIEIVAKDTFYDLAGLVGLGDETALALVKGTPVSGSPLTLGEALERACSKSSWRTTKRDDKPAVVFSGTLKAGADKLEAVYTVAGETCSVQSVTLNGEAQTVQMLDAIVAGAAK